MKPINEIQESDNNEMSTQINMPTPIGQDSEDSVFSLNEEDQINIQIDNSLSKQLNESNNATMSNI